MQTVKQDSILSIASDLASLELTGNDTIRLAKRIYEGQGEFNLATFADILTRACPETIEAEENFLIRFVGMDLVVYGPGGYAVIDHLVGIVDFCYLYGRDGENYHSMSAHHMA